jgi:hypothetical protein
MVVKSFFKQTFASAEQPVSDCHATSWCPERHRAGPAEACTVGIEDVPAVIGNDQVSNTSKDTAAHGAPELQ